MAASASSMRLVAIAAKLLKGTAAQLVPKRLHALEHRDAARWNMLAAHGRYEHGCDYFVPVPEDAELTQPGWAAAAIGAVRSCATGMGAAAAPVPIQRETSPAADVTAAAVDATSAAAVSAAASATLLVSAGHVAVFGGVFPVPSPTVPALPFLHHLLQGDLCAGTPATAAAAAAAEAAAQAAQDARTPAQLEAERAKTRAAVAAALPRLRGQLLRWRCRHRGTPRAGDAAGEAAGEAERVLRCDGVPARPVHEGMSPEVVRGDGDGGGSGGGGGGNGRPLVCAMVPVKSTPFQSGALNSIVQVWLPSLLSTMEDGFDYLNLVGFDYGDPVFDNDAEQARFLAQSKALVAGKPIGVTMMRLYGLGKMALPPAPPAAVADSPVAESTTSITGIWNFIAAEAYHEHRCDYFFPANDDLVLLSPGWTAQSVARLADCPLVPNFGVAAYTDIWLYTSPTFHLTHRTHMDLWGAIYYPLPSAGAHQDSWAFSVYEEWGCGSKFKAVKVRNRVGNATSTIKGRYDYNSNADKSETLEWIARSRRHVMRWLCVRLRANLSDARGGNAPRDCGKKLLARTPSWVAKTHQLATNPGKDRSGFPLATCPDPTRYPALRWQLAPLPGDSISKHYARLRSKAWNGVDQCEHNLKSICSAQCAAAEEE